MKLALIQQHCSRDREDNLARGVDSIREAARSGAEVVAFAELSFEWFHPQRPASGDVRSLAEPIPGPTTERLSALAKELGVVVVTNQFERDGQRCFDTSTVIDADGELLGRTRMLHITDFHCFHERGYYAPGDLGLPVYDTRYGKIGVVICYDRHYPEAMRAVALDGAEVVIVPQAGAVGEWPEGLFEGELRVASLQNGYFTALVNRVGAEETVEFAGESFVCDPTGVVIARAGLGRDEILIADIDRTQVATSQARRLFLRDRRPELYAEMLARDPDFASDD